MTILKVRRSPFTADGAAPDFQEQPELNLEQQEAAGTASLESDGFAHRTGSNAAFVPIAVLYARRLFQ